MTPASAIEAAALAIFGPRVREWTVMEEITCMSQARRALEAATPYMLADAWQEGKESGFRDAYTDEEEESNPYRSAK